MAKQKTGYRDDGIFGDGITDPLEVTYHETQTLGNVDIPSYILKHYKKKLNKNEIDYLTKIVEYDDDIEEIDKTYYQDIIRKIIGDRDFCLWLCKSKRDVYDCYIDIMPNCKETFEDACQHIDAYDIPDDAIVLSEGKEEGALYVWKSKQSYTLCIEK